MLLFLTVIMVMVTMVLFLIHMAIDHFYACFFLVSFVFSMHVYHRRDKVCDVHIYFECA